MSTQQGDWEPAPQQPSQAIPQHTQQQLEQRAPVQPTETAKEKLFRQLQSLY